MADNIIRVSVQPTKRQSVNITAGQVQTPISATADTSLYYSNLSKNWAIGEGLIQGEDYSSKHYANKSKASAQVAESFEASVRDSYNNFVTDATDYINELTELKETSAEEITMATTDGLLDIRNAKEEAVLSVQTTKNDVIADITTVQNSAISNVEKEAKEQLQNIESTGFYMRDDKLYFINSKGEEEEFKSGGGGGLEIGDIGFTQMAIDETKGKRRILNGQLIIQEQYVQFTNIIKNSVALNPDLACTEEEWQTAITMSTNGVCYKFVIDDEAGTIRLPKYPNYLIAGLTGTAPVVGDGNLLGLTLNNGVTEYAGITRVGTSGNYAATIYVAGSDHVTSKYPAKPDKAGTSVGSGTLKNYGYGGQQLFGVCTKEGFSGLISKLSNDQTEQIKGTYFIQVATGVETEDNIINEIELNNPFSLLDYKYSEYELNNISWLRSNGQYNSKAIYPAVYDLLLKIYNGVETKAGVSVKLSTEDYTDYDFVLNTAEETFRLPLLDGSETIPDYSNYVEITGAGDYTADKNCFVILRAGSTTSNGGGGLINVDGVRVSDLNTTNGTVSTAKTAFVQKGSVYTITTGAKFVNCYVYPCKGNGSLYFYVGETVQNANLINAGRIEEKIADLIPDNSSLIAGYGIPDYTAEVTIASGFVAPCSGYVKAVSNSTTGTSLLYVNGIEVWVGGYFGGSSYAQRSGCAFVAKGDVITETKATGLFFYPLKGDK